MGTARIRKFLLTHCRVEIADLLDIVEHHVIQIGQIPPLLYDFFRGSETSDPAPRGAGI